MKKLDLKTIGIINPKNIYRNLDSKKLIEFAVSNKEGILSNSGSLCVTTGKYTGRSPNDKFIVDSNGVHKEIAWGKINKPISQEKFNALFTILAALFVNKDDFQFNGNLNLGVIANVEGAKKTNVVSISATFGKDLVVTYNFEFIG